MVTTVCHPGGNLSKFSGFYVVGNGLSRVQFSRVLSSSSFYVISIIKKFLFNRPRLNHVREFVDRVLPFFFNHYCAKTPP